MGRLTWMKTVLTEIEKNVQCSETNEAETVYESQQRKH